MKIRPLLASTVVAVVAAGSAVAGGAPAHAGTTLVPFRMDASNQAGWWKPIEEFNGRPYLVYNAWGSPTEGGATDRHTVYVARREADGTWTRGCLKTAAGACVIYPDDIGHHQPTLAIDGHGYLHAFVSMHDDNWRYYRSVSPGDVTSMVDRSAQMPDQGGKYTYPATTRTDNGDIYLIVRSYPAGRLYRWDNAANVWSRVATFASQSGFVVYPDDISSDATGALHITWEWSYNGAGGLRHVGSYLRYIPASRRFANAAGATVAVPATTTSPVAYQPIEGSERITDRNHLVDPGVQSAKVAVRPDGRPVVAYRYRSTSGGPFRVRLAEWTGSAWRRSVVYAGAYDTTAAVDVTATGSGPRVYYAKAQTLASDQAFVASPTVDGGWVERLLLPGVPVERLSVIRRGSVDHLYLASPGTHELYYGTNPW